MKWLRLLAGMLVILIGPMTEYAADEWIVQTPALSWPNTIRAAAVPAGAALMIALGLLRLARVGIADLVGVTIALHLPSPTGPASGDPT